ncbi:MAG: N-acetylglucosamine kinase [Vicinamibacterales bacterium]
MIGIDAGGTKTVCQLADENGAVVQETRGPGANLQAVGELEVEKVLHDVMERAIRGTGALGTSDDPRGALPAAICLGIAGVDREDDAAVVGDIMRRIGYKARVLIVNDALVALEAGVPGQPGVVVIAGTGSIAYGRNARGEAARAGGWGYVLGDEGSGYWIGRTALRAVLREADRRGEPTSLTGRLLMHFGVSKAQDLIHEVYYGGLRSTAIAALAPHVQQAYEEGDNVAGGILDGAARELTSSALSVGLRLGLLEEACTVVLAGGVFKGVPWLVGELTRRVTAAAARASIIQLEVEPASGAVRLALAEARGGAKIPVYL